MNINQIFNCLGLIIHGVETRRNEKKFNRCSTAFTDDLFLRRVVVSPQTKNDDKNDQTKKHLKKEFYEIYWSDNDWW
jgi:hypothetical protein